MIDTLSIVPDSEILTIDHQVIPDSLYRVDYARALLIFHSRAVERNKPASITYRVFPVDFSATWAHRQKREFIVSGPVMAKPEIQRSVSGANFITDNQLDKRGSILRGVTIGNRQDAVINSKLNLQLAGKIGGNMDLLAAISDENIPLQPDGNSQQIQEFDKVFIQLSNERFKLVAGDFEISKPEGYYMNLNKKAQGGLVDVTFGGNKDTSNVLETTLSGAVSKGKLCRKKFQGQEGNQGPYRLTGCENELYIIVLAGTEKVYIDGRLQVRGKENDYIIDYNTGEITFTANRPITKNSRITVEFEYSEKSYARFMVFSNNTYQTGKGIFWLNIYSEQDSKNQPLNQDLTREQKQILAQSGDNILDAWVLNVDTVSFRNDYVLYRKVDTVVNGVVYEIYKYSIHPEEAIYQVGFSFMGEGQGNYIPVSGGANGRVYAWVAPEDGVPQGSYEPVRLLIAPKKQQMINLGGDFQINETTHSFFEIALSNYDLNTFSEKDQTDNTGYAIKMDVEKSLWNTDTLKNRLTANITYQLIHKNFTEIERFRPVEFERDWNLEVPFLNHEHYADFSLGYRHKKNITGQYQVALLHSKDEYNGLRNVLNTSVQQAGYQLDLKSSLLNTTTEDNETQFIRYIAGLSKSFQKIKIGFENELEHNEWRNIVTDSLLNNSFNFSSYRFYVQNSDSMINKFNAGYLLRNDLLPRNDKLVKATRSEDFQLGFGLLKNPASVLKTRINYRKLKIIDTTLTDNTQENTLTGRVSYNFRIFKGALSSSLFYEAGSGLEPKKEFSYLKVAVGQGTYAWTDYNSNSVAELDEFEVAKFQDEANYIRIYKPGNDYLKTYQNEYSQVFNIRPETLWKNQKGWRGILSKFSNSFAMLLNQKSTNTDLRQSLNPFHAKDNDSMLVHLNQNYRNTFSFNRLTGALGVDYIYQQNHTKTLLTNGFDERKRTENGLKVRWNFISDFILQDEFSMGTKEYHSEFFSAKNYELAILSNEFKIQYQPGFQTRIELNYRYAGKENRGESEKSFSHTAGAEINYTFTSKGNLFVQGNYIYIDYNANRNTSLAYEMLDGLNPGNNATWNITMQRKLAGYLELNVIYSGRVSETNQAVHSGSIQLRAYF
jgi:hypothetical protein